MGKASTQAQEFSKNIKDGTGSAQIYADKQKTLQKSVQNTGTASKVAAVGVKALSIAGNRFLGMAISWGINKLLNLENEALSKSQKAYQNTLDEVNKVKEKEELVFSSTKELSELLKSEKWGADSAKAASQIYQNMADELERVGDVENSRR